MTLIAPPWDKADQMAAAEKDAACRAAVEQDRAKEVADRKAVAAAAVAKAVAAKRAAADKKKRKRLRKKQMVAAEKRAFEPAEGETAAVQKISAKKAGAYS